MIRRHSLPVTAEAGGASPAS